jgi:hypothetical protein
MFTVCAVSGDMLVHSPGESIVIYKLDLTPLPPLASPSVTGASTSVVDIVQFVPWQPSSWPEAPSNDEAFTMVLKRIFELSMLMEINNVIEDADSRNGGLENRGHVILISMLCALDAISSYGYGAGSGKQIPEFVLAHFPGEYKPFSQELLYLYRHATVHSWNLFEVAIRPDDTPISSNGGIISFGLRHFLDALKQATEHFLQQLARDKRLQTKARTRYNALRNTAKPTYFKRAQSPSRVQNSRKKGQGTKGLRGGRRSGGGGQ